MTTTPLFLDQNFKPTFEKLAMPVKLSDTPENWQKEIASEIFKQVPFIADYAVNVMLDRVDQQRGYAFGAAEVTNQTDAPEADKPPQTIRIPLVVKDRLLQPLDIFLDSNTAYALNERRVREHMFRTDAFETSTRKPTDQGMADQLYPPLRTNYGYGNATATGISGGGGGIGKIASADEQFAAELEKTANIGSAFTQGSSLKSPELGMKGPGGSGLGAAPAGKPVTQGTKVAEDRLARLGQYAHKSKGGKTKEATMCKTCGGDMEKCGGCGGMGKAASLVEAIAPTISAADLEKFTTAFEKDAELALAAVKNPRFLKLAQIILATPKASLEKRAEALVSSIAPTVVQLTKLASGEFLVKWANAAAFAPQEGKVGPAQANQMAGADLSHMQPGASVTVSSTEKAKLDDLSAPKVKLVEDFGQFQVTDAETGESMAGTAIPVVDFDMIALPMYIWTNGEKYAAQDEIAGIAMGQEPLPESPHPPQGDGVFYFVGQDGRTVCTPPVTIQASSEGQQGNQLHAQTVFGEELTLVMQEGLTAFQKVDEGSYLIPALGGAFHWLPLQNSCHLIKDPAQVTSQAEAVQSPQTVDVGSTGKGEFSVGGGPISKVAAKDRQFIKAAEAEFLLVAMGVSPFEAREKLAQAEKGMKVKIAGVKPIIPLAHVHAEMTKKAAAMLAVFPWDLKRNLVKEAAALEDSETADKILSMNFINPENVSIFASYMPQLDDASSKLAEMLMAARLGMHQVPEAAAERAMKNLEEVISGLKALQQKNMI